MMMETLSKARYWLLMRYPYLASALYALRYIESEQVPTMSVDKNWNLYYNPEFVSQLSIAELGAVLYHEILHLLRQHAVRLVGYPQEAANLAADAEINDDIRAEGLTLPSGAIYPELLGQPEGRLAEEYAEALLQQLELQAGGAGQQQQRGQQVSTPASASQGSAGASAQQQQQQQQNGCACTGTARRTPTTDAQSSAHGASEQGCTSDGVQPALQPLSAGLQPANGSAANGREQAWENGEPRHPVEQEAILQQVAEAIQRHTGTVPAHLKRVAQQILTPKRVDWRRELAAATRYAIASCMGAGDYTYSRPSRRQSVYSPVVIPSLRQPIPRVAVVVDTSGSITDHEIGLALEVIDQVVQATQARLTVYACDAKVHAVKRVMCGRDAEPILYGGGGTNMRVGIDAALQASPRPQVVIVITDGYTPWGETPPIGVRVIAVLTTDVPVPDWVKPIRMGV